VVDTINELSGLATKLNQKSDALNQTIATLNKKLLNLNLGIEVWVGEFEESDPFFREEDEDQRCPLRTETWLGYAKVSDVWQLASKNVTVGPNDDGEQFAQVVEGSQPRALLLAPRSVRANAMRFVPSLLNVIKTKAESVLKGIEAAEKAAAKL
jgi:hypothetical protein